MGAAQLRCECDRVFRSPGALRAHRSRCRRPRFPGVDFAALIHENGLTLSQLVRAAGYPVPSGVVTRVSEFIHGKRQPGPHMLVRLLEALGALEDPKWRPWLSVRTRSVHCAGCGGPCKRKNLRAEERARLDAGKPYQCADCARKAAGTHVNSLLALVEAREEQAYAGLQQQVGADAVPLRLTERQRRKGLAARPRYMRERFAEKLREADPTADVEVEFERRRRLGMAGAREQRAIAVFLGRILNLKYPIHGFRLDSSCGFLVGRSTRRQWHPCARPSPPVKRGGPPLERNLDRNVWLLVAARTTPGLHEALPLPFKDLRVRAEKIFPEARRLGSPAALTMAIKAAIAVLPGDAALFLPKPSAQYFARALCGPATLDTSLGRFLKPFVERGDRDERIRRLHDGGMSVEGIGHLTGAERAHVKRVITGEGASRANAN